MRQKLIVVGAGIQGRMVAICAARTGLFDVTLVGSGPVAHIVAPTAHSGFEYPLDERASSTILTAFLLNLFALPDEVYARTVGAERPLRFALSKITHEAGRNWKTNPTSFREREGPTKEELFSFAGRMRDRYANHCHVVSRRLNVDESEVHERFAGPPDQFVRLQEPDYFADMHGVVGGLATSCRAWNAVMLEAFTEQLLRDYGVRRESARVLRVARHGSRYEIVAETGVEQAAQVVLSAGHESARLAAGLEPRSVVGGTAELHSTVLLETPPCLNSRQFTLLLRGSNVNVDHAGMYAPVCDAIGSEPGLALLYFASPLGSQYKWFRFDAEQPLDAEQARIAENGRMDSGRAACDMVRVLQRTAYPFLKEATPLRTVERFVVRFSRDRHSREHLAPYQVCEGVYVAIAQKLSTCLWSTFQTVALLVKRAYDQGCASRLERERFSNFVIPVASSDDAVAFDFSLFPNELCWRQLVIDRRLAIAAAERLGYPRAMAV